MSKGRRLSGDNDWMTGLSRLESLILETYKGGPPASGQSNQYESDEQKRIKQVGVIDSEDAQGQRRCPW